MAVSTQPAVTGYRFNVTQYDKMIESGIFCDDTHVELIDGEVLQMAPMGDRHISIIHRSNMLFTEKLRDVAIVGVQTSVRLNDRSEPEPDISILHRRADFYAGAKPTPADTYLVIEIGDSTLAFDRGVKISRYARVQIAEAWLVDVEAASLTVYRDPSPDGYRTVQTLSHGDRVSLTAFPDREIAVTDLLG